MYRALLLFPGAVDPAAVERIVVDEMAPLHRESQGFRSMEISVGPLMGPAAQGGGARVVVEVTFETLDDAMKVHRWTAT